MTSDVDRIEEALWPMEYSVTVVFGARDPKHAADVLEACADIASDLGGGFHGGWGGRFTAEVASVEATALELLHEKWLYETARTAQIARADLAGDA